MKVFRVRNDVNRYQYFLTQNEEDALKLKMDCSSKVDAWKSPQVFVYKPKNISGDFHQFGSDIIIANSYATEALRDFFEMAGELLPLPYNGEEFTLLNIMKCIDCLDHERTEWLIDESTGEKILPLRYFFVKQNFTSSRLFKIPETCGGEVLAVDFDQDDDEEIRGVIKLAKLRGLIFEKIWDEVEDL